MIKVGFIGAVTKEWMGGVNYYKNLLCAISLLKDKEFEIIVFVGRKTDNEIKSMFKEYALVIEDCIFDRKSLKWFFSRIEQIFFRTNNLLNYVLKKYGIQVLSHASIVNLKGIKTINWIPDFQHLHLLEMFSKKEIDSRNNVFMNIVKGSDIVILSSYNALNDFRNFAPQYERKVRILQFVSQPSSKYFEFKEENKIKLFIKYSLPEEFFYLPNQFWKHKNHMLVFKAIKELIEEGNNIYLVCTGYLEDYRNKDYIHEIQAFIKENKLEVYIRFLGLVEYDDVFGLIKFSKAVINPSLFEGWSSTVEECKSVGKNMILSDLEVHKEQYPEAIFFNRDNLGSLKNVLKNYIHNKKNCQFNDLDVRTQSFAKKYIEIVTEVLK